MTWQLRCSLGRPVRLTCTTTAKLPRPSSYANCRCRSQIDISVRGWRFAPACCAAQSVRQRGQHCTVTLHRLPWAAKHFCNRSFAYAIAVNRPEQMQTKSKCNSSQMQLQLSRVKAILGSVHALRPNRSLNRTHCGVPPFGLEKPSPNASTPQWAG